MTAKPIYSTKVEPTVAGDPETRVVLYERNAAGARSSSRVAGSLVLDSDGLAAYAGHLCCDAHDPRAVVLLIQAAALHVRRNYKNTDGEPIEGVIIHTEGKNTRRKFYDRLGLRDMHGVEGGKSGYVSDVLDACGKVLGNTDGRTNRGGGTRSL